MIHSMPRFEHMNTTNELPEQQLQPQRELDTNEVTAFISSYINTSRVNIYNYASMKTCEMVYNDFYAEFGLPTNEDFQAMKEPFKNIYKSYVEFIFSAQEPPAPQWDTILNQWKDYERLTGIERALADPTPVRKFIQNLISTHVINTENKYTNALVRSLRDLFVLLHDVPIKYKYYIEDLICIALDDHHISFRNEEAKVSWP